MKKIICLDFDGVIHSYTSGWKGPRTIPDPPVKGALEWMLDAMAAGYEIQVLSSRSRYFGGRWAMRNWLKKHAGWHRWDSMGASLCLVKFVKHKPPALVSIDDRGWRFNGTFPSLEEISESRPWNKTRVTEAIKKARGGDPPSQFTGFA